MTTELTYLLLTAILTGLLWIPSVLGQVQSRGMLTPENYVELPEGGVSDWAKRANRAHQNAVENLSAFAVVVLIAHAIGYSTALTATCAIVYFGARLAHAVVFITGFKHFMARTVLFTISWASFLIFAIALLQQA